MPRFSVSLTDDQNAWVEERAEALNGSKTQVISMLVDAARDEEGGVPAELRPAETGGDDDDDEIRAELERLTDRIDELEARVDATRGSGPAAATETETGAGTGAETESTGEAEAETKTTGEVAAEAEAETEAEAEMEAEPVAAPPGGQAVSADSQVVTAETTPAAGRDAGDANANVNADTDVDTDDGATEPLTRGGSSAPNESAADESTPDESTPDESVQGALPADPEAEAIREFVDANAGDAASPSEVVACWQLLKRRGTASPKVFKGRCFEGDAADEAELERWWADGVRPVLERLPGVAPPKDEGRFYRYKY